MSRFNSNLYSQNTSCKEWSQNSLSQGISHFGNVISPQPTYPRMEPALISHFFDEPNDNFEEYREQSTGFGNAFEKSINFLDLSKMQSSFQMYNRSIDLAAPSSYAKKEMCSFPNLMKEEGKEELKLMKNEKYQVKTQNLKIIAGQIFQIIRCRRLVTPRQISEFLYKAIERQNSSNFTEKEQHVDASQTISKPCRTDGIAKNLRRRLYDAINVMMAANIIYRINNKIALVIHSELNDFQAIKDEGDEQIEPFSKSRKNQLDEVTAQLGEAENRIAAKKLHYQNLLKKKLLAEKLIKRNKFSENNKYFGIFHFPFMVLQVPSKSRLSLRLEQVRLRSEKPVNFQADLDSLQFLFFIEKQQIEQEKLKYGMLSS